MKWINCLLLLCITAYTSVAQITIQPSDMPTIGVSYQFLGDTATSALSITPSSATAQNWNYTNAFPNPKDTITWNFVNKSTLPGASNFPSAQFGFDNKKDSAYLFLTNDTDGLYVDGTYTYISLAPNVAIVLNPKELFVPTNFTYNSTRTQNAKGVVLTTVSGYQVKLVTRITSQFTGDAFGNMTTPTGTYSDVLRIKKLRIQQDSIYLKIGAFYTPFQSQTDSVLTYSFLEKSAHAVVCDVEMESPTSNKSKSGRYSRVISVGIKDQLPIVQKINVYPNPMSDVLQMDLSKTPQAQQFVLIDMTGRTIMAEDIKGIQNLNLSVSDLPHGVYQYQLRDGKNNILGIGNCVK